MSGLYPCEWRTSGLSSAIVRRSARTTPGVGRGAMRMGTTWSPRSAARASNAVCGVPGSRMLPMSAIVAGPLLLARQIQKDQFRSVDALAVNEM